jgi:hypothetical protein
MMNIWSHHSSLFEGEKEIILSEIKEEIEEKTGIPFEKNVDVFEFHFDNLLIDHTHKIKEADIKSSFTQDNKVIIISFESITREAQNALLKVLEEPMGNSRFVLITRTKEILLPTIISRVQIIRHSSFATRKETINIKEFIDSTTSKRLEMVSLLLKEISEEIKPKKEAYFFLLELKQYIENQTENEKKNLKTLLNVVQYIDDTSASQKLLLERVCFL